MKVNSLDKNISFNGFYNSKGLTKLLEFAADNSYLFAGTTTLLLSTCVRPLSIMATPNTDKENKKYACAKSLSSSIVGYLLALAVSIPFSKSVKAIDKEPAKYLKKETITVLKENSKNLTDSKAYQLGTQMFKLGLGLLIAAPKAILTALGVPVMMDMCFGKKNNKNQNISFKGKENNLTKNIGKIIDKKSFQDFTTKYKDSNFPMHIVALTDLITTGTFAIQTSKSKKIEENRKRPLIYNATISTALSIASAYTIDKLLDKPTEKFIDKLKNANKNCANIDKLVHGVKIAKPILIMGTIYYIFIPILSTFLAEKFSQQNKAEKTTIQAK